MVDLHNWIEYNLTPLRSHNDRYPRWGTKGANSDSHPSQMIPQSRVIHRYVRNMPITLAPPLCNYDHGTINPDFLSITGSNVFGDRRTDNRARWAACACNLYLNKPRTKPQDKYERSVESCTRVRAIFARLRLPSGRSVGAGEWSIEEIFRSRVYLRYNKFSSFQTGKNEKERHWIFFSFLPHEIYISRYLSSIIEKVV